MDYQKVKEQRLKVSRELFSLFFEDAKHLPSERVKEMVADFISERLRDEKLIQFFQNEQKTSIHQSVHVSDEEIAQTILTVGGQEGYEKSQSSLPYELWLQTQMPAYKRQFGEVEPQLFYHGTSQQFSTFDDVKIQSNGRDSLSNNFGNAHYFTPSKDFAKSYGGDVKTVLVNTQNFIDVSHARMTYQKPILPQQTC